MHLLKMVLAGTRYSLDNECIATTEWQASALLHVMCSHFTIPQCYSS